MVTDQPLRRTMTVMRAPLTGTRRADGRWQITITLTRPDGAKVRKTIYAATQREVQEAARTLLHDSGRRAAPVVTVSDLLDVCEAGPWREHADKTKEQYAWARQRIDPALGSKKVGALTVPDVAIWVRQLEMDTSLRSGRSVQICRNVLRVALSYAVEMGWMQTNPAKEVRVRKATPIERRRLSENEYLRVIAAEPDPIFRTLWRIIGECGLRPFCEATQRTRADLVYKMDAWWIVVKKSKTGAGIREVPVPDDLADELADRQALLFPSTTGTILDRRRVDHKWKEALARAEVPDTNLYQLRKLALTRWSLQGLPDVVVKALAGHSDIRLTQNTYARIGREQILAALEDLRK